MACAICQEDIDAYPTTRMPCHPDHVFHSACILQWMRHKHTCPLCRDPGPPMRVVNPIHRAVLVRRFAKERTAPLELKHAVLKVDKLERKVKGLRVAIREFRREHKATLRKLQGMEQRVENTQSTALLAFKELGDFVHPEVPVPLVYDSDSS